MAFGKKSAKDKLDAEINAGSMADIAFLLLIFFLVTTTIAEDKGILVRLPEWSDAPPDDVKVNKRNVFSVLVNANNELLVRGEHAKITELKDRAKRFIMNPGADPELAENPTKAVISLKNDRGTKYSAYLEVYNELKAAYSELWNDESQKLFGVAFSEDMPDDKKKQIKANIPLILSEAETAFGEEAK